MDPQRYERAAPSRFSSPFASFGLLVPGLKNIKKKKKKVVFGDLLVYDGKSYL